MDPTLIVIGAIASPADPAKPPIRPSLRILIGAPGLLKNSEIAFALVYQLEFSKKASKVLGVVVVSVARRVHHGHQG